MTRKNVGVIIAFENAKIGERVEIRTAEDNFSVVGHVIEKSPNGYYDIGWCIRVKIERMGTLRVDKEGSLEVFREEISSFKFLREEGDMQLSLPFEEDQLPLGYLEPFQ
jgi:hypothetical protein